MAAVVPSADTDKREHDAVPAPEGSDPLGPGQGNYRGNRQGDEEAGLAAAPQDVGFRVGQDFLGIQVEPAAC